MSNEQTKMHYIDRDLDSYKSFYDHDWAQEMFGIAAASALASAVFDYCESLKAAANTARLPWLTI